MHLIRADRTTPPPQQMQASAQAAYCQPMVTPQTDQKIKDYKFEKAKMKKSGLLAELYALYQQQPSMTFPHALQFAIFLNAGWITLRHRAGI